VASGNLVSPQTKHHGASLNSSVLVVDDEEHLLILLDRVLSKEGYQVKTAIDAYKALEFLDENYFRRSYRY